MRSNIQGALIALLSFALYSTHDVVIKLLGVTYSSVQIVFFTALLGFPVVSMLMVRDSKDGSLRPRHPWWLLLRTVCGVVTGVTCFYAFSVLPLAQTYTILFATPLLITVLAIPFLGERVGIHRGLAVLVGLIGVLIVLRPMGAPLSIGHLAALVAAMSSALGSVIVRKIGREERPVVMLLIPMMANVLILGAALPFVYVPMPITHLGMMAVVALLSLIAGLLSIAAYRRGEAAIVAPMQYSQMIWATIYGYLIFREAVDLYTALGAGVIILSGLYIVTREARPNVSANSPVLTAQTRPVGPVKVLNLPRLFERRRPGE